MTGLMYQNTVIGKCHFFITYMCILCLLSFLYHLHVYAQDPEEFQVAYDAMMSFINVPENWTKIEEELKGRGVSIWIGV